MEPNKIEPTRPAASTTTRALRIVLLVGFGIAAILIAYLTFASMRDFIASWESTDLEGISIQETAAPVTEGEEAAIIADVNTPLQSAGGPTPEPWDGVKPVTLLVMGLDYRDWERGEGPPRTDTMILLTIDPLTKTAGMMNIPRDLWVNIPGFDHGKINTAYPLGESWQVPGGGPALAMETVEGLLGVPIDYYAQIDFSAFENFIDELGGIEIDVPAEIKVDPIGKGNTVVLQPGRQTLDGPVALAYARARYTDGGDFDRAVRQQEVVMAIWNKAVDLGVPQLITKAPQLYQDLASGIHTNLSLEDAIKLAWLAAEFSLENFKRGAIAPPDQVLFAKSPDGSQDILKPIPDKIRLLRDDIFASTSLASPAQEQEDLAELMRIEGARLSILNGTFLEGLASRTEEYLKSQGANIVSTGNAGEAPAYSKVIDYTGNPYTLRYLVQLMNITPYSIIQEFKPDSPVDVEVILGADWANNNPLP